MAAAIWWRRRSDLASFFTGTRGLEEGARVGYWGVEGGGGGAHGVGPLWEKRTGGGGAQRTVGLEVRSNYDILKFFSLLLLKNNYYIT